MISHRRVVSRVEFAVPIEIFDFTDIVGQPFQIVTCHQQFVTVKVFRTAPLLQPEFIALEPGRIVESKIEVVSVPTDILGEVIKLLLYIVLVRYVPCGVIRWDNVGLGVVAIKLLRFYRFK